MSDMWYRHDIFIYDSLRNGKCGTSKRQILIGRLTHYSDEEYYFTPLWYNEEWGKHNYHGPHHRHNINVGSPMCNEMVKVTEEEAEAVRIVLLK